MQIDDAIHLIAGAAMIDKQPSIWADLGCGGGVFTQALASLLSPGSVIYAVDRSRQFIPQPAGKNVEIKFVQADFEKDILPLPALNGILMANSLHYVADKYRLLERLKKQVVPDGVFIILEYDTMQANPWVPYPAYFAHLQKLLSDAGFERIVKLAERKSVYGHGNLYACLAANLK